MFGLLEALLRTTGTTGTTDGLGSVGVAVGMSDVAHSSSTSKDEIIIINGRSVASAIQVVF